MKNKNIRKLKKVSKILSKIEWEQHKIDEGLDGIKLTTTPEEKNELKELCRELLNKLDNYISKETETTIIRHYRYFTFEVDDIK